MKENSYGIRPRNAEQTFAMHAVLNKKSEAGKHPGNLPELVKR